MNHLEVKAEEFIDLDNSEEFQRADALVKKHAKMLNTLKERMKRDGIQKIQLRRGNRLKRLAFSIRKMNRIDTVALPDEIKDAYMKESETWWKSTDILELEENLENGNVGSGNIGSGNIGSGDIGIGDINA